jgi:hypothetical protein
VAKRRTYLAVGYADHLARDKRAMWLACVRAKYTKQRRLPNISG